MITVRYFAAAAEAAGVDSEQVAAATVRELRQRIEAAHGAEMARVLPRCSLLAAGLRVDGDVALVAGTTVDVLPPFAGG